MSICVTIVNNKTYCDDKHKTSVVQVPCDCVISVLSIPAAHCDLCEGSGFTWESYYPFEVVIPACVFEALWSTLRIRYYASGSIAPHGVIARLSRLTRVDLRNKFALHFRSPRNITVVSQLSQYVQSLGVIAREAEKREEYIAWG